MASLHSQYTCCMVRDAFEAWKIESLKFIGLVYAQLGEDNTNRIAGEGLHLKLTQG